MVLSSPDGRQNRTPSRPFSAWWTLLFVWMVFCTPRAALAEDPPGAPAPEQMIRITSDSLEAEMGEGKSRWTEFTGNVKATQGDAVIESDTLRIHIDEAGGKGDGPAGGNAAIEKVVAAGNVRIKFEEIRAETEKAIYTIKDRVLILTGADTSIQNGPNRLTGSKITLYRADGRITVQGKGSDRVRAVFFPSDGGLE